MLEELNVRIDDSEMYIFPPTEEKDGKREKRERGDLKFWVEKISVTIDENYGDTERLTANVCGRNTRFDINEITKSNVDWGGYARRIKPLNANDYRRNG